jgi:hypothetical protein
MSGARRGLAAWPAEVAAGRAVYEIATAVVRGAPVEEGPARRAARASVDIWARVLDLEGCAGWLDRAGRSAPGVAAVLAPAQGFLRAERERGLRNAVAMVQQLAELAPVAAGVGARVLVLKGSARLLAGEPAGDRSMADIDLLVPGDAGDAMHAALRAALGYASDEPGTPDRHLPALVRPGSLPIEIHRRVADAPSALDSRVWDEARQVALGDAQIEIPSPTALVLHAIEHATVVHRAIRYRLRDVLDVATLLTGDVDGDEVRRFVSTHAERRAALTLLRAARSLSSRPPSESPADEAERRAERRAWRRIRRVGRARLLAPVQRGVPAGSDPRVLVLSQLAEGAPGRVLRLVARGLAAPGRALRLVAGRWLPVEAERARAGATIAGRPAGEDGRR